MAGGAVVVRMVRQLSVFSATEGFLVGPAPREAGGWTQCLFGVQVIKGLINCTEACIGSVVRFV